MAGILDFQPSSPQQPTIDETTDRPKSDKNQRSEVNSDDDEEASGQLQIAWNTRKQEVPRQSMLSELKEEDYDPDPDSGQRSYHPHPHFSQSQDQLGSRPSKWPLNGHQFHQRPYYSSNPSLSYNYGKQIGTSGRKMKNFLEQFNFTQTFPHFPPPPPGSEVILNNNNYKEGTVKDLLNAQGQRSDHEERRAGHFVPPQSHDPFYFSRDREPSTGPTSLSPHSKSSPATTKEGKEVKPDFHTGTGLNLLSRSLGTALLNLASLGNPATVGGGGGAVPLNLSNGGSPTAPRTTPSPPFNTNNFPQLILASGQIVQGIQGAQVLIPSPQGLLTQTVLTIPITQPLSPGDNSTSATSAPPKKTHQQPPPPQSDMKESTNQNQHVPLISQKMSGIDKNLNIRTGLAQSRRRRSSQSLLINGRRETTGSPISEDNHPSHAGHHGYHGHYSYLKNHHGLPLAPVMSKMSPTPSRHEGSDMDEDEEEDHGSDFLDRCSDNDDDTMMDGINLDEIKEFAKAFKLRRLSLGLTQTQVGQALSVTEGPAYSQSAICSALAWQLTQAQSRALPIHQQQMFEKLDITPKSAQKIKPVLEKWMKEAEDRYRSGNSNLNEFVGMEPSKKRKRRTSFTPQALEILNTHFERNTHPSGAEITTLAHQLGYEREVIRIWFCNKRQALKNTVRMMSKSGSPA